MDAHNPASVKTGSALFYSTVIIETRRIDACLAAIETSQIKPIAEAFRTVQQP
jgi:hypothetical protein